MFRKCSLCAIALSLGIASLCYGQAGLGSISGRITDASGAGIPNARVIATNVETNLSTTASANGEGSYQILRLTPAQYTVSAEAPGFKKLDRSGILLQVDDKLTIDMPLDVGMQSDTVSISAEATQLRTEDAQSGEVITNRFIENLPQLNRDPLQLVKLAGNVQGSGGENGDTRINGSRTSGIEYFQDGIPLSSGRGHGVTAAKPDMDAVQEFKVVTNGISAEYGRLSGGFVEVVTKSGTNQFHGQAYDYLQNNLLNANSWQQNALGGARTPYRQNDFGGTFGGPVWLPKIYRGQNRTFFFADYEGFRNRQSGSLQTANVPTEAERMGDFSNTYSGGIPAKLYDPYGPQKEVLDKNGQGTGVFERLQLLGGDGKHVPQNLISPTTAALLKLLPLPNRRGNLDSSSAANFVAPQNSFVNNDRWSLRLDHNFTANSRIFGRFSTFGQDNGNTRWFGPLSTASQAEIKQARLGTLDYDWAITPTFLFNARAGVDHSPGTSGNLLPPGFTNAGLNLPAAITNILGPNNMIQVQTDFMGALDLAKPGSLSYANSTTYDAVVSATKILGRHTIKFGFEHRRYYDNFYNSGGGLITFDGNPVDQFSGDHGFGANQSKPNSLAAALLGIDDRVNVSGYKTRAMNFNYNAAYVQDDFKFNKRLTLNLGLRWDREGPATERHDKLYLWDPNATPNFHINSGYNFRAALANAGITANLPDPAWVANGFSKGAVRIANTPEYPSRGGGQPGNLQFAPRIGLAFQINPKTVLRSSFGVMYLSTTGDPSGFSSSNQNLPLTNSADAGWHPSDDNGRNYISTWANPFPHPDNFATYQRDNQIANKQSAQDPGPAPFNAKLHQPYEMTWHAGIQRELPNHFLFEADYSANRGLQLLAPNLISRFPKNLFVPQNQKTLTSSVASPTAGQTLETQQVGTTQLLAYLYYPYPYYGAVNVVGANLGASTFHSMNLRVERRFAQGVAFLFNYTLSRNLDNVGGPESSTAGGIPGTGTGGKTVQSVDDFQTSWGLSALDQTHRLVAAYSVELPIGRGKRLLGSPQGHLAKTVLDYVVGGWELAGFTQYRSGTPLHFTSTSQNINNNIKVEQTFGSFTSSDHNVNNSNFAGDRQVLYSSQDPRTAVMVRRFDPTKVSDAQKFTYGNLPAIYGDIRNPGFNQTDLSLMKKFMVAREGKIFLQTRLEAQNSFNIRGFGAYNTKIGDRDFGLITGPGNTERRVQVSARLVF